MPMLYRHRRTLLYIAYACDARPPLTVYHHLLSPPDLRLSLASAMQLIGTPTLSPSVSFYNISDECPCWYALFR